MLVMGLGKEPVHEIFCVVGQEMAESPEISVVIGDQCCNVTIISLLRDITMGILGKLKARD